MASIVRAWALRGRWDGVAHSDCGRIRFALDAEARRFIVATWV
ncbi:hypothetical protein ACFWG6_25085 [Streptomyces erythrochromogenes]